MPLDGDVPQGGNDNIEITLLGDIPECEILELGSELGRQMELCEIHVHHRDCGEIDHSMAKRGCS